MITLINLPQPNSLDDKLDPPLGMMYIAAVLRESKHEVKIVDLAFIPKAEWPSAIGIADVYGMTVFSSSYHLALEVKAICKYNNPECKIVVGGPHPTSLPQETAKDFDYAVQGEGEYAFFSLETEKVLSMPLIRELDTLPFPARDLVDIHAYTRKVMGKKATTIQTARGCMYSCAFCCKDVFGSKMRSFSVPHIIREMQQVIHAYDINHFFFEDDTFVLNNLRFKELCSEIRKLNVIFRCNGDTRSNFNEYRMLYETGCREICFGIESGSQKILDAMNKGSTVDGNKRAIEAAQKAGLVVKAFLIIGFPGETAHTVEETKRFMQDAGPDQFTLFTFVPLPGCDVWKHPEKYGARIIDRNWKNYYNIAGDNDGGIVIETDKLNKKELFSLRKDLVEFLRNRGQRGAVQDYYGAITN